MSLGNRGLIPASSLTSDREAFDYRQADDFYQKSLSEHTRQAYRPVIREFFTAHRDAHPADITPKQALAWRDSLVKKKQKPETEKNRGRCESDHRFLVDGCRQNHRPL